jgi:hypothetical protein
MKLGVEVEGRLKGIPTLFLSAEEVLRYTPIDLLRMQGSLPSNVFWTLHQVRHLYVSDHGNALHSAHAIFQQWALPWYISLEVTAVVNRKAYPTNVGFLLSITDGGHGYAHSFFELQDTDQIKFSSGNPGYVFCTTKEAMTKTRPEDFFYDTHLPLGAGT